MHRRLVLASSVAGAAIAALDGTVLTVVQPTLQRELGASLAQVQWTSTAYLVAVASLLVSAGRIGDRYGHQRVFGLGMLGFGAASAGIGLAPGVGWVIGLRVVQGCSARCSSRRRSACCGSRSRPTGSAYPSPYGRA
jgi:MFS family permease